jgi:hypothetical protein
MPLDVSYRESCMTLRWKISPHAAPAIRRWGNEYVVHHALSNDTFRLSVHAGSALVALMADDSDLNLRHAGSRGASSLDSCLSELAELGFVARC